MKMTFKRIGLASLIGGFMNFAAMGVLPPPVSVTLGWDASSDSSIAGYRIHQGTASGVYPTTIDAGAATQKVVSGLVTGVPYFFTVTAYYASGMESPVSNEIIYKPGTGPLANLQMRVQPNRQVLLTASGPPAYQYDVLATQRFTNWTVVGSLTIGANGTGQFTDTAAPNFTARSYRLHQTLP
jgi:hypothetical protein